MGIAWQEWQRQQDTYTAIPTFHQRSVTFLGKERQCLVVPNTGMIGAVEPTATRISTSVSWKGRVTTALKLAFPSKELLKPRNLQVTAFTCLTGI